MAVYQVIADHQEKGKMPSYSIAYELLSIRPRGGHIIENKAIIWPNAATSWPNNDENAKNKATSWPTHNSYDNNINIEVLLKHDVWTNTAKQILSVYPPEYIMDMVKQFEKIPKSQIKNPGAFLAKMIRNGLSTWIHIKQQAKADQEQIEVEQQTNRIGEEINAAYGKDGGWDPYIGDAGQKDELRILIEKSISEVEIRHLASQAKQRGCAAPDVIPYIAQNAVHNV